MRKPLVAALFAMGLVAMPAEARAPGDTYTAGLFTAPRLLERVGDYEITVMPGLVLSSTPRAPGLPLVGQLGFQYVLTEDLQLDLIFDPISMYGLRGRLWESEEASLVWGAHVRTDTYPTGRPDASSFAPGLSPLAFGLAPLPGLNEARGGELRLGYVRDWAPFRLSVSPLAMVMSNRSGAGAEVGAEVLLGPAVVGYTGSFISNLYNPWVNDVTLRPIETVHGIGGRWALSESSYLHAAYFLVPGDAYGNRVEALMAGVGFRAR